MFDVQLVLNGRPGQSEDQAERSGLDLVKFPLSAGPRKQLSECQKYFRYCSCHENLNPPTPPFPQGETQRHSFGSSPLKRGI